MVSEYFTECAHRVSIDCIYVLLDLFSRQFKALLTCPYHLTRWTSTRCVLKASLSRGDYAETKHIKLETTTHYRFRIWNLCGIRSLDKTSYCQNFLSLTSWKDRLGEIQSINVFQWNSELGKKTRRRKVPVLGCPIRFGVRCINTRVEQIILSPKFAGMIQVRELPNTVPLEWKIAVRSSRHGTTCGVAMR